MIDLKDIRKYNFERDATGIKFCDGNHGSHEACNYTDMDHEEVLELLLALRNEYLKTYKDSKSINKRNTLLEHEPPVLPRYPPPNKFKLISDISEAIEDGIYYFVKNLNNKDKPFLRKRITQILSQIPDGVVPAGKLYAIHFQGFYNIDFNIEQHDLIPIELDYLYCNNINPIKPINHNELALWGNKIKYTPKDIPFSHSCLNSINILWAITCLLHTWLETSDPLEVIKVGQALKNNRCIMDIQWDKEDEFFDSKIVNKRFCIQVLPIMVAEPILIDFHRNQEKLKNTFKLFDSLLREKV